MDIQIPSNSLVAIVIPESASTQFLHAANVLQQEIQKRSHLAVEIISQNNHENLCNFSLVIRLATVETLTDDDQNTIDPPVKILPYPDYSDHINIRTVSDNPPIVLIVCGSDKSICAGIGMFFSFISG
jgi:hypothetical protein